jgi:CDP-diacylglycerol--glycerol-3-phosphate 3-phosphatidyltransferase
MISIYKIKPKFQALLMPILNGLHKLGVTANMITWAAILLSVGTGVFTYFFPCQLALLILPISLFLRMALNALDGMMARIHNMQSKKGEILNELGDVVSDFIMFYPIGVLFKLNELLLLVFLFLSVINEYAGILGKAVSGERRYEGPMGKSDRAFVVGLFSLLLYFIPRLNSYSDYIFYVVVILLITSTLIRINKTINLSK